MNKFRAVQLFIFSPPLCRFQITAFKAFAPQGAIEHIFQSPKLCMSSFWLTSHMPPARCDLLLTPELSVWKTEQYTAFLTLTALQYTVHTVFEQRNRQQRVVDTLLKALTNTSWSSCLREVSRGREHFSEPLRSGSYSQEFSRQQMAKWKEGAPPHQHLGGISVNRDGGEGLEGKSK